MKIQYNNQDDQIQTTMESKPEWLVEIFDDINKKLKGLKFKKPRSKTKKITKKVESLPQEETIEEFLQKK